MEQQKTFKISVSKKTLKWVVRVVAAIAGLYILLLVGLSIYISSSKQKLLTFLNSKLKETILGELKINKADITIWQTFPKIGITLENVTLSDSFYHKPFLKAGSITAKAGFLDLIGNRLRISKVEIDNAVIHTFIDKKGYANSYVLNPQKKSTKKSKKPVVFGNFELKNITAISEDAIKNKRYMVRINEADAEMSFHGSKYHIKFDEDMLIGGLGFNLEKGYWLQNQRLRAKWKLEYDTGKKVLSISETKIKIQDQPFKIKGEFNFNAPAHFHIEASTSAIPYNAAMAILKPTTREKINKINLSEPLDAKILLDGLMAYRTTPLVKVDFSTKNNNLSTPVLNFNECDFSGTYFNQVDPKLPQTDSNSRVSINTFTSKWGDINVTAKNIAVTNLIKPVIQFEFFSQCTLQQLDEELASSTLHFTEGNAKLYLAYDGPLIADPSLLDQLNAKIQIQNGKVVYVPRSITFSECNGLVNITGNNLHINNFQSNLNTNHFVLNVTGKNLNRFSSKEAGKATIDCNVYSPSVNLADFKALFAKKAKRTSKKKSKGLGGIAQTIDNAVENGDMFINIKADTVSLHNFKANNVNANVYFKQAGWEVQRASLLHADGNFNLTAQIHEAKNDQHQAKIQVNLQHINVKKLFYGFDNFGQTSITYKNINGIMDSKANINVAINSTGKLVTSTTNGDIFFSLKNASLVNLESLKNIQKYVFKNRNLDNVKFADLENTFDINNGDIFIRRMPIQSSAITMYIEGTYSFADRTDISIQVPLSTLTNKPEDYKTISKSKSENPGASVYLRAKDKDGQVKIGLDVFKKMRKNKHNKDDGK